MLWVRARRNALSLHFPDDELAAARFCDSEIADKPLQGRESIVPCCRAPWVAAQIPCVAAPNSHPLAYLRTKKNGTHSASGTTKAWGGQITDTPMPRTSISVRSLRTFRLKRRAYRPFAPSRPKTSLASCVTCGRDGPSLSSRSTRVDMQSACLDVR